MPPIWHVMYVSHDDGIREDTSHAKFVASSHTYERSDVWVTWRIHTCDMTHPYVCCDSSIRVTWLVYMCDATHSYVYMRIHTFGVIRSYVWLTASSTGWRRPIGRLKLQVIFCKRATNYRALLRKITCEDKASYESSPPCIICGMTHSYV